MQGIIMKNLNFLFDLLLFPFLFILQFSLSQKSSIYFHLRRQEGKRKLITTFLLVFGLGFTSSVAVTFTSGGTTPFVLVNPPNTRNVIGNYAIAGNTVLCLTEKETDFGGTCHGDTDYQDITNNMHVVRYIDIDSNDGTWNSTSSYIDFSTTAYSPSRGIIWAGLFWGGRISVLYDHPKRYAVENGANSFKTVDAQGLFPFDITKTGATRIKLKVDNGNYNDVTASKFHTSPAYGGQTYSAYADVSSIVQAVPLDKGKHVFTVANLTTMEGREDAPGAFGGWSLVIIYAESYEFGSPKNISIYNGFIDIGKNDTPIEISGFKLPTSGDVDAKISIFSGEGEHPYGPNDWMKISRLVDSGYDYLDPTAANKNNMFDAKMTAISRDKGTTGDMRYNALGTNNVGVEVDNFDVSTLMTNYRAADQNINTVYVKTYSDLDYITTSMIAFSAEIYVPKLCYDYTLDIDGYVLDSVNNIIKTPFGGFGKPLTTVLYLKNLEGDIPLSNVDVNLYHQ